MFYVKVSESFSKMITISKQDFYKNKKSNFLKSEFNKNLFDKNQIRVYPNQIWYKGSRYR